MEIQTIKKMSNTENIKNVEGNRPRGILMELAKSQDGVKLKIELK